MLSIIKSLTQYSYMKILVAWQYISLRIDTFFTTRIMNSQVVYLNVFPHEYIKFI
jgi:hypothetical protein